MKPKKITIPKGWRKVARGRLIKVGDKYFDTAKGRFLLTGCQNKKVGWDAMYPDMFGSYKPNTYIRKVTRK